MESRKAAGFNSHYYCHCCSICKTECVLHSTPTMWVSSHWNSWSPVLLPRLRLRHLDFSHGGEGALSGFRVAGLISGVPSGPQIPAPAHSRDCHTHVLATRLDLLAILVPLEGKVWVTDLHHQLDLVAPVHLVGWIQLLREGWRVKGCRAGGPKRSLTALVTPELPSLPPQTMSSPRSKRGQDQELGGP